MPWLKKGQQIGGKESGRYYRVATGRLSQGGFGEVYRGHPLDDHEDDLRPVAIKVTDDALSWLGESFFGRLLWGQPHVVTLLDFFVVAGNPNGPTPLKYVLIMPWFEEGTLEDALNGGEPWTEGVVLDGVRGLLNALELLHNRGICHGDITPRNVFVNNRELYLADLGIAGMSLHDGGLELIGQAPMPYQPPDLDWGLWSPAADVYQVGLLGLSLLSGQLQTSWDVSGKTLKALEASDHLKGWIREACSPVGQRFVDARDALACLDDAPVRPARPPRSLKGQRVVLTGKLPMLRPDAKRLLQAAGASYQSKVNAATSLVVTGEPGPLLIGKTYGTKLFDARRRVRRGQKISIIGAKQFQRLLR